MIQPRPGAELGRFHVLGERSSGTNLMKRLMGRNSGLQPTEALGWKHGFPQMMAIPADLLIICMVRDPGDWARSMFAKPWHAVPEMQALEFPDFIRAPWDTVIDRPRYFGGKQAAAILGQPLQQDRDPLTGARFASLFALRRVKLTGLLSYLNRDCACVLLRTETLQAAPEATIDRILADLSLPPRSEEFRGVFKRLGSKFKPAIAERPAPPDQMSTEDRAFMWSQLDTELEDRLGYGPDRHALRAGE